MRRPVGDPAFANDVVAGHCPSLMRVGAVVAVVAENKVVVGEDLLVGVGVPGWFRNVGLD